VPPQKITRTHSSDCVCSSTWANNVLSVPFMLIFVSVLQAHSWHALLLLNRRPTLLRATAHSRLLGATRSLSGWMKCMRVLWRVTSGAFKYSSPKPECGDGNVFSTGAILSC
jgi:hypothetical protein